MMLKAGSYVGACEECKGKSVTVYTTSGVKLTGMQCRVLYGTREAAIASVKGRHTRIV
jgi:hypothetical protein